MTVEIKVSQNNKIKKNSITTIQRKGKRATSKGVFSSILMNKFQKYEKMSLRKY